MSDDRRETPDPQGRGSAAIGQMPRVGAEFASYRIQGVLGRGGMSVVFRADNLRLGNEIALKVLSAELSENDAFRERFVRESRLAASINHPNIIPIYDAGEEDGLLYIAMRYVAGSDLKSMIRQEGPISLRRAADIISQVARGLSVAHERGLVHRDIKPANILTERAGGTGETVDHAYLADFGLMKHQVSRSGLTDTGQFLGTVDYVAPEQVEGRQTDHRADVYSLGCVLYESLTGSVPYPRDSDVAVLFAHVQDVVPRITDLRPDLPPAIDEIAARAMAKRPEHRYGSAGDLSRELSEAVGVHRYSQDRPVAGRDRARRFRRRTSSASPEPVAQQAPPGPPSDPGAGGAPPRPSRGRPSTLVIALAVALAAALAVIAFQLTTGSDSGSNAGRPPRPAARRPRPAARRARRAGRRRRRGRCRRATCASRCPRTCSPSARTPRRSAPPWRRSRARRPGTRRSPTRSRCTRTRPTWWRRSGPSSRRRGSRPTRTAAPSATGTASGPGRTRPGRSAVMWPAISTPTATRCSCGRT